MVLYASVLDKRGTRILDLQKENFRVFENNVEQQTAIFSRTDIPVTMGIVIDDSASMRSRRKAVAAAALVFVQTSNSQDQVFVVNFNDQAYIDTPGDFASNEEDLKLALDKIVSRGGTALYDAVQLSLDHLKLGKHDKKVLLVISDGGGQRQPNQLRGDFPLCAGFRRRDLHDRNPGRRRRLRPF